MKTPIAIAAAAITLSACANTTDLAKTLRYADNNPVGVENIRFVELQEMKRGIACTTNVAYIIPLYGDGSIITAAEQGGINSIELIGETGRWYFPFSQNCTVVFGDSPDRLKRMRDKSSS